MQLWAMSYGTPVCIYVYILTLIAVSTVVLLSGSGRRGTPCTVHIYIPASIPDRGRTMSSCGETDAFKVSAVLSSPCVAFPMCIAANCRSFVY